MTVHFKDCDYEFVPWRTAMDQVFNQPIALDTETMLIDQDRPWLAPAYVIGAAFDGVRGFFIPRDRLGEFLAAHPDVEIVFHNAPFDLDVINTAMPAAKVYDRVDANAVWDTQLMHRLLALGERGDTARGNGQSTLENCAAIYLDVELPKDILDSEGDPVRFSYGKWLNQPLIEMEHVYLEYLASDVIATQMVHAELRVRTQQLLQSAAAVWGCVSDDWLNTCIARFGPQTVDRTLK